MTKKLTKKQFVQKANEKHNNKYKEGYGAFEYINTSTKSEICCPEPKHGTFPQTPSNHLRGKGCPKCGNLNRGKSNRSNKDAFILKANEKHDNKYDYTLVDYKRLKTHITIICPEHGNFIQSPDNHLQGAGCSKCGRKRTEDGHRLTTEEFVSNAKKIHPCDKYDYSQVDYKGAKIKVTIICPEHGPFKQTPDGHLSEKGCNSCAIKKNSDNQRGTKESFIQKSRANPSCRDHNGNYYDYDLVEYKNAHTKVKIKCLYHDKIFTMIPNNHSHHGQKCNDCGLLCLGDKMRQTPQDIIDKSNKKYNDNFEIKFIDKYKDQNCNIRITCKKHQNSFADTVTNHLNYTFGGCKECATENRKIIKTDEEYKKDVIKLHGNKFKYHTKYTGCHDYLTIECENGHIFKQSATSHLSGNGCCICSKKGYSKGQIEWLEYLMISIPDIQHKLNGGEYRITDSRYAADGYSKEKNTIYEYHGDFWHGNPSIYNTSDINPVTKTSFGKLYQKTLKKQKHCIDNEYQYIFIWESVWERGINSVIILQQKFKDINCE